MAETKKRQSDEETIFEKCPLCHSEAMVERTHREGFWRSVKVSTCSVCGALFVRTRKGRYRLRSCDPERLGVARRKKWPQSGCADCPPVTRCFLGRSLTKSDWRRVEKGETTDDERARSDERLRWAAGALPTLPEDRSPIPLGKSELLHLVTAVYACEQPLPGRYRDEGTLVLTSKRIVLLHEGNSLEIGLDEISKIETAFPGFLVYVKGSSQPFCFFPLRGDPLFDAVQAAYRRARGEN